MQDSLEFLGEITEDVAESLGGLLSQEAARWPALSLEYAGIGRFPERGAARVLWAGCTGDIAKLAGLDLEYV